MHIRGFRCFEPLSEGLKRGLDIHEVTELLHTEEADRTRHQRVGINWHSALEK